MKKTVIGLTALMAAVTSFATTTGEIKASIGTETPLEKSASAMGNTVLKNSLELDLGIKKTGFKFGGKIEDVYTSEIGKSELYGSYKFNRVKGFVPTAKLLIKNPLSTEKELESSLKLEGKVLKVDTESNIKLVTKFDEVIKNDLEIDTKATFKNVAKGLDLSVKPFGSVNLNKTVAPLQRKYGIGIELGAEYKAIKGLEIKGTASTEYINHEDPQVYHIQSIFKPEVKYVFKDITLEAEVESKVKHKHYPSQILMLSITKPEAKVSYKVKLNPKTTLIPSLKVNSEIALETYDLGNEPVKMLATAMNITPAIKVNYKPNSKTDLYAVLAATSRFGYLEVNEDDEDEISGDTAFIYDSTTLNPTIGIEYKW